MNSEELRQKFLEFFEVRGHKIISSASLLPENDPSVLFTTAGMHPLVPYLLGEKHPLGEKLCNVQKCLRTDDINEVGDNQHCTFFEMLGYWSLGDYFKKESIHYTFDFYTQVLGFNKDDISVTVFAGDENTPFDQESFDVWKNEIGIPEERIYRYGRKENWWGPVGNTGPCGPDTEMFIDTGLEKCSDNCGPSCHCDKFVEIGNNVFMEYNKTSDGKYMPLKQKNVDVGLGFERLLMFSQNKADVFETDLFQSIIKKIEELSGKKYSENQQAFRIIADHLRATTFLIADGVEPSNKERGYIVRRLIRRAIVKAGALGIEENFTSQIAETVIETYENVYPELENKRENVKQTLQNEEEKFRKTLSLGLKEFEKVKQDLTGEKAFKLYETYGFPLEMTEELALEQGMKINKEEFQKAFQAHQEKSRTASAGMFKGGLADSGEETRKLHTVAHLLLSALRKVLGDEVYQKGSNITAERLRFDFSYPEKMTAEQLKQVEILVNEQIQAAIPVELQEMSLEDAKKSGAMGVFESKYGDQVKVYTIGNFSKEICGGPHAKNTSELGHFKIIKEESSSAGVRRIKAILE
jgi:alanyl-tRNA synthetase